MGLEVIRIYKNAAEDTLRVDTITWTSTMNTAIVGVAAKTYRRHISINKILSSGIVDRTVAIIDISTNADIIDPSGNYTYVRWNTTNETIQGDMSDLPIITDTV